MFCNSLALTLFQCLFISSSYRNVITDDTCEEFIKYTIKLDHSYESKQVKLIVKDKSITEILHMENIDLQQDNSNGSGWVPEQDQCSNPTVEKYMQENNEPLSEMGEKVTTRHSKKIYAPSKPVTKTNGQPQDDTAELLHQTVCTPMETHQQDFQQQFESHVYTELKLKQKKNSCITELPLLKNPISKAPYIIENQLHIQRKASQSQHHCSKLINITGPTPQFKIGKCILLSIIKWLAYFYFGEPVNLIGWPATH